MHYLIRKASAHVRTILLEQLDTLVHLSLGFVSTGNDQPSFHIRRHVVERIVVRQAVYFVRLWVNPPQGTALEQLVLRHTERKVQHKQRVDADNTQQVLDLRSRARVSIHHKALLLHLV